VPESSEVPAVSFRPEPRPYTTEAVAVIVQNYPHGLAVPAIGLVDRGQWEERYGQHAESFIMSDGDVWTPWDLEEEFGPCEWLTYFDLEARLCGWAAER
jgi:hypothetical protein